MNVCKEIYSFREKVLDPTKRVLIYEVVPPEPHTTVKALKRSARTLVKTLGCFTDLDAVYIPEVIDESDRGNSRITHQKVPARRFASSVNTDGNSKELIITHPFAYTPKAETEEWLHKMYNNYGINNLVVVGPTHQHPDLPGYSVTETLQLIAKMNERKEIDIFPGAICIDTRRTAYNAHLNLDEPDRMVQKIRAGAQFFTSQLCYSDSIINLLQDYKIACEKAEMGAKRIFVSVSPISSRSTLKVIEGLIEREIDDQLKRYLFSRDHGIGNRSIQRIEEMLTRIFDHCYGENLGIPLGICVEHVTDSNFRYALELLDSIPEIWKDYHPDSEFPTNLG